MATSRYVVTVDDEARFEFSGDFAQASSPILLDGGSTPYQVADASHRPARAANLLIEWAANNGHPVVGPDEDWEWDDAEDSASDGE